MDFPHIIIKHKQSVLLDAFVLMCPNALGGESVPRREMKLLDKLHVEGIPKEEQNLLRWFINMRLLLLSLLFDKFKAWLNDLTKVLEDYNIMVEDLNSLTESLNHASYVIPLLRHFLSRLQ